ncbi:unnamed protein product, partial [Symbiodinium necroappetens]
MSFSAHETLVCFLIRELQKEPLPGFSRVNLTQVQAADRECHVQLARLTRAGFSTPGPGKLPLDDHLATVLQMASIHWILMPTRSAGKGAQPTAEDHESTGEETGPRKRKKKKKKPVKETDVPPPPPPPEGQPERKKLRGVMPQGLRGGVPRSFVVFFVGELPNGPSLRLQSFSGVWIESPEGSVPAPDNPSIKGRYYLAGTPVRDMLEGPRDTTESTVRCGGTPGVIELCATCDGAHAHKSWGLTKSRGQWDFRTTGTAEYPSAFCKAAASDFMEICASRNAFPAQEVMSEAFGVAAAVGRQPRGQSFQAGPSEFGSTCTMHVPVSVSVPDVIDGQAPWPLQGLPLGSRLLNSRTVTGEGGEEGVREVKFGIFRTPDAFLREALKMRHPFDEPSTSDMGNIRAMQVVLERGVEGTKTLRQKTLDYYRRREIELRSDEEALKATMDPQVREVMTGKNLLLFQEMARDAGVEDPYLFEDLNRGFRLIGSLPPFGQFPKKLKPAVLDESQLKATARWSKHLVEASCKKASPDLEVARAVWAETLEQVEKSWMKGPFSWAEIEKKYNGCWIPSKRFGVAQSDKVRSVDDLSEFLINSAVTETEKITLEGIDHIVSLARFFLGATTAGVATFRLPASDGQWVTGRLHSDWRGGKARLLRGRALDLKAAYKQLARHPKDGWVSIVAVLNPDSGEVSYFEAVALPFGAVSAVTGFNRAARALRRILSILFSLAIEEVVMQCVSERRCDRKRMLSIKGKLLFAAGHVFGRCAQLATQLISHRGNDRHPGREQMNDLLNALRFALETLKSGGPRCVGAWSQQPPVLVFTDGACEQEGNLVTHGALLFDPVTGRKEVFGDHVPKCLVERWKGGGKKQVIFFAEIFPVVVAKATWKDVVQGRRVLFFLDNEGARFTFIRSYS